MIRDLVRRKEVHFDRVVDCRLHVFFSDFAEGEESLFRFV